MTRTAFLGTPEAAIPTLDALSAITDLQLVVTQPDRPRGRSGTPQPPPVKIHAETLGIPVEQPTNAAGILASLQSAGAIDAAVVVAYGRLIRLDALAYPRMGMLNVHFSLLPRWRGAAPVNRALMEGDPMTGVSIIKLDEGLDTGPVLNAQAVDIYPGETAGELTTRLAHLGARLLADSLPRYLDGHLEPVPQSDDGAVYASKIEKADRVINPRMSMAQVVNLVRGLAPEPGATLLIDGAPHKVLAVAQSSIPLPEGDWAGDGEWPVVGVSDGALRIERIQPPGRNEMGGDDWVRGKKPKSGIVG